VAFRTVTPADATRELRATVSRRRPCAIVVAFVTLCVAASLSGAAGAGRAAGAACVERRATPAYAEHVDRALRARRDLWGERLLAAPDGPTYAAASRYLAPLLYARGRGGRALTRSGVYYIPFAMPKSLYGEKAFALHVADGSEVVTRRAGGRSLSVLVGRSGTERYGSCLARLEPAKLVDGYLPILRTEYVDGDGVRYRQESFAGRVAAADSLASFVRLQVDARHARSAALVRLLPSTGGLVAVSNRLVSGLKTQLAFSAGGRVDGSSVAYRIPRGARSEIIAVWVHRPVPADRLRADRVTYRTARDDVVRFWRAELDRAATFVVPEERVADAQRNLLIQQLIHTWRYSIGNTYEELSFAEALGAARVMASYGFEDVSQAILRFSLRRLPVRYTNWRGGARLVAGATHYRLYRDRAFVEEERAGLAAVLDRLAAQILRPGSTGLLDREQYSTDIGRKVLGFHAQAVVWQGLRSMSRVWATTGHRQLGARATELGARLERGLRAAVRASTRRLADGSLFVPAALLDDGRPFDPIVASREGTYWNLVIPYALASGFIQPQRAEARGTLQYLLGHGSRLLGLVRAGATTLYGAAAYPVSGTDQVYGLDVARFLADNDRPDELVLSLYGTLAAGMTPNTYVSGEAATVAPLEGERARAMYLPPNGGAGAAFLENLRLLLVHETRGHQGAPRGLELAFGTPRPWLRDGRSIRVRDAPTSFGRVSYAIERRGRVVRVNVAPPAAPRPSSLRLRLRLPSGEQLAAVTLRGRSVRFDRKTGTIELPTNLPRIELHARVARGALGSG